MKFEIKAWLTGKVLFSLECGSLKACVEVAVDKGAYLTGADLKGADLTGADLTGAYLKGAYLTGADLTGADLTGADLKGAYLTGADLTGADLTGADLTGAYLKGADLKGADLTGAYLKGADLTGAYLTLPTGETLEDYLTKTVPALLVAGGKKLAEIATPTVWNCHAWDNCPMAKAFDVHSISDVPILHRPRAEQFVSLFDARQIPLDVVLGEKKFSVYAKEMADEGKKYREELKASLRAQGLLAEPKKAGAK